MYSASLMEDNTSFLIDLQNIHTVRYVICTMQYFPL